VSFKDVQLPDFLWAFIQVLDHNIPEEIFIVHAVKELYLAARDALKNKKMNWKEVTNVLIEMMHEQDLTNTGQLGSTKMTVKAEKKIRHPRAGMQDNMIKKLQLELPDLIGEEENKLSFFVKSPNVDRKAHKTGIN
jgi:hypothetical protein